MASALRHCDGLGRTDEAVGLGADELVEHGCRADSNSQEGTMLGRLKDRSQ